MLRIITYPIIGFMLASLICVMGCSRPTEQPPVATAVTAEPLPGAPPLADEHAHKPGAHGGTIISTGRESYHAEAVFETGGVVRLFMLGQDESRVIDVESQTLTAYVKADGDTQAGRNIGLDWPSPSRAVSSRWSPSTARSRCGRTAGDLCRLKF